MHHSDRASSLAGDGASVSRTSLRFLTHDATDVPRQPDASRFPEILHRRSDNFDLFEIEHANDCLENHPRTIDGFDSAVRPILGMLLDVSRRILWSEDLAWDAVQEALICLWEQGEITQNPRAWLVKAVVYRSLHLKRSLRRRRSHEARAGRERREASVGDDPFSLVTAGEIDDSMTEALSMLSEEHRDILMRLAFDGLDYASISRALGVPVGTVRSRINRSRSAIRSMLNED